MLNTLEVIQQFKAAIESKQMVPPMEILPDGCIHRFSPTGKTRNKDGWYILHLDGKPSGAFGDWKRGIKHTWSANYTNTDVIITPEEIKRIRDNREQEQQRKWDQASIKAGEVWNKSIAVTEHPYLKNKGVLPHGARQFGNDLVIPLCFNGKIMSLQFINPLGKKMFLPGGRTAGCYHFIGYDAESPLVFIAEGFATAATIHQCSDFPVAVAFNAGNLGAVAKEVRKDFPDAEIVICADDDQHLENNIGLNKATEAAGAISATILTPAFGDQRRAKDTDFNDLFQLLGLDAVMLQLSPVISQALNQENKKNILPEKPVSILDKNADYVELNLGQYLDKKSLFYQFVYDLHLATFAPISTITMVGLGIFSAIATRRYVVDFERADSVPIGLYVCAEQPSGTSKSRIVENFQMPFFNEHKKAILAYQSKLMELKQIQDKSNKRRNGNNGNNAAEARQEYETMQKNGQPLLFITNATGEALENSLHATGGFFSCVSAEQGLFNSIFGLSYTAKDTMPNRDVILQGFDGGFYGGSRVTRKSFYDKVFGGITLFAQNGSIQTIINTSNDTGLAERFIIVAEPHALGTRKFSETHHLDMNIRNQYDAICTKLAEKITYPIDKDNLQHLHIKPSGWELINEYREHLEPHLADGGNYANGSLRGQAAKVGVTIMKIAANLHLINGNENLEIADSTVTSAINIVEDLLNATVHILDAKQVSGYTAACNDILNVIVNTRDSGLTKTAIQRKCYPRSVFKNYTGNKADLINESLDILIKENKILAMQDNKGRDLYVTR